MTTMKLSEAVLLSKRNARFYAGQLGEEKFERCVAPHVRTKKVGDRVLYFRADIDRWAGVDKSSAKSHAQVQTLLDRL